MSLVHHNKEAAHTNKNHHEHGKHQQKKHPLFYICGPPQMVKSVSEILEGLGVVKENILFEKWSSVTV